MRHHGIVKWFSNLKGFGFITDEADQKEAFVHYCQIDMDGYKTLDEGEVVTFDLVDNGKGPAAHNVRRVRETIR